MFPFSNKQFSNNPLYSFEPETVKRLLKAFNNCLALEVTHPQIGRVLKYRDESTPKLSVILDTM